MPTRGKTVAIIIDEIDECESSRRRGLLLHCAPAYHFSGYAPILGERVNISEKCFLLCDVTRKGSPH